MSTAVLNKLCAERDETVSAAMAIAESDDFNPEDKTYVELRSRATDLDKRITSLSELLDQQAAADQLDGKLAKAAQTRAAQQEQSSGQLQTRESWGSAFVRSQEYLTYPGRGTSAKFEVEDDIETRALPTGIAELVAAGMTGTAYQVDVTAPPAPTPLLNNITSVAVSGNSIEAVSWQKVAGGAAVVAEKAAKPSAEWAPTVTPTVLDTIAVWTKLTRQLIEDAAAVRSYIDGELRREVMRATEAEALAALGDAADDIPDATGATLLAAIRVGMGTVMAAGYTPTAVVLNPVDWAEMDVAIMGDTLNGPRVNQGFWGLTPIPSTEQDEGTALVGDLRSGVQHFYRSGVSLYTSDSAFDGDFTKNLFTLLAEQRSKTLVVRPQALVEASAA